LDKNNEDIKLFIENLSQSIEEGQMDNALSTLEEIHPADIADILCQISTKHAVFSSCF